MYYKPKSERLSSSILEQYPCKDVNINKIQKKQAIYVSYEAFSDNWNEWIYDPTSDDIKADLISPKPNRSSIPKLSILQELFKACTTSNIKNASNPQISNVLNGKWTAEELFTLWSLEPVNPIIQTLWEEADTYLKNVLNFLSRSIDDQENECKLSSSFHGEYKRTITCTECKQEEICNEQFTFLKLPIPNNSEISIICDIFPGIITKESTATKTVREIYRLNIRSTTFRHLAQRIAKDYKCSIDEVVFGDRDLHSAETLKGTISLKTSILHHDNLKNSIPVYLC